MPYITQRDRDRIKKDAMNPDPDFLFPPLYNGGELNYLISNLCAQYIRDHGLRYKNISDVIGALEGAKQEFFRKVVNPYENLKEMQNGGVYDSEPSINHLFEEN
jgi:hypothetical protein